MSSNVLLLQSDLPPDPIVSCSFVLLIYLFEKQMKDVNDFVLVSISTVHSIAMYLTLITNIVSLLCQLVRPLSPFLVVEQ